MPDKDPKFWISIFFFFFCCEGKWFLFILCLLNMPCFLADPYCSWKSPSINTMDIENNSALQLAYFKCYVSDLAPASYMRLVGSKIQSRKLCQSICAPLFSMLSFRSHHGSIAHVLPGQWASHTYCSHSLKLSPSIPAFHAGIFKWWGFCIFLKVGKWDFVTK